MSSATWQTGTPSAPPPASRAMHGLYAFTIFAAAFLLFAVQPIVGRMVLPWFGGSASVWTICLLFFQTLLLLGYLYAHLSVRWLTPTAQRWVHVLLLAASIATLPLGLRAAWRPTGQEDPALHVVLLLVGSVGLPYFVLSTTSPLLQSWYARQFARAAPYRLFALSNFASMTALLTYPLWFEPTFTLRVQASSWSAGYVLFAATAAVLAWRVRGAFSTPTERPSAQASARLAALWILLATCPSILLVAITTHLTQNVAPIPLLWVAPLAVYLLSFILCFESERWYRRAVFLPLLVAALIVMTLALLEDALNLGVQGQIALFTAGLFIVSMACHGELARLRPHPSLLTRFYLMVALGGMLGGLFVGLIAPHLLRNYYELPIGLVLSALAVLSAWRYDRTSLLHHGLRTANWLSALGLIALLAMALGREAYSQSEDARVLLRNFYGVLKVEESRAGPHATRILYHGRIVHGLQLLPPNLRDTPTTYYARDSGIAAAIMATRGDTAQRVGIVGLGAGTLAAYGRSGDTYRFYEINPLVIALAREQFSFLSDSKARIETVLGDARLSLEREAPQGFDVLAVDAFSGDSIPVHLLTREAMAIYRSHLKPNGILAVHVSNQYLDLLAVVKVAADHFSLSTEDLDTKDPQDEITYGSKWVLIGTAQALAHSALRAAQPAMSKRVVRLWTDDYASMYPLLQ